MCGTQEPMGYGLPVGTHTNFKWAPGGSGFQVGTQKVGSNRFRVPTKIFFVPTLARKSGHAIFSPKNNILPPRSLKAGRFEGASLTGNSHPIVTRDSHASRVPPRHSFRGGFTVFPNLHDRKS